MTAQITPMAQDIFERRYKYQDETFDEMLQRVSTAVAESEEKGHREEYSDKFYNLMASGRFLPNSPTLFNAGTGQGLLSACFLFVVDDSLVSMMECHRLAGLVMKYGGGVGYTFSRVRPKGTPIKTVQGRACGPVALLPYYNSMANLITQGGKRSGAQMGVLSIDHEDITDFIHAKDENPDDLHTFNISVAITDAFMKRYVDGDEKAKEQLHSIAESTWRTGDPGVFFIDEANRHNPTPWLGDLEGTNPCGEVPLLDKEACNLGSHNLGKYVNEDEVHWEQLGADVKLAVRLLDDVITANHFPDSAITEAVNKTRKIGLGVMGWADMLALLHIPYDCMKAVNLALEVMKFIQVEANKASFELGDEKGVAPAFEMHGDTSLRWRNATRTCIAPTGSISQLAGCSSGIEPHYELEYTRTMYDKGDPVKFDVVEPVLEQLRSRGDDFIPKTALEIGPEWHIRHQAAFQRYTDLAVSKTVNVPESTSVDEIEASYVSMWEKGCKGGTIYRDNCRNLQVLSRKEESITSQVVNGRLRLPDERNAKTVKFSVGGQEGYFTVGEYENGQPGEVFIKIAKEGTTVAGMYDVVGILTSLALQYQVPLESIVSKLEGMRFEPYGPTTNPAIGFASSIPDYIFRWLRLKYGDIQGVESVAGLFCPDCNGELIYQEGCLKCKEQCGYDRCG